jgi:hypothetical protein
MAVKPGWDRVMIGPSFVRGERLRPAEQLADPILDLENPGADDGIRTRDPHLGKVVLYH